MKEIEKFRLLDFWWVFERKR